MTDQGNTVSSQEQVSKRELQDEARLRKIRTKKIRNWIIFIVIMGAGGYGIMYLATRPATPRPGVEFEILGREHIEFGAAHEEYNSNPPTSGSHYSQPADWGVYEQELSDEQLIHNLEHGGIWISYRPDVAEETRASLETLARRYPQSVVLTPRTGNDSPIALASWGRLEKLDGFDEVRITEFIKLNRNKSPEPLAR